MRRIFATILFVFLSAQSFAKERLKKFRWSEDDSPSSARARLPKPLLILPGVNELVTRSGQTVGRARVEGAWTQTILNAGGKVVYATGAVSERLPREAELIAQELQLTTSLEHAMATLPEISSAGRVFPPSLEVRQESESVWVPYWRIEYLTPEFDQLRYVLVSKSGDVLARGQMEWDGVDGRAIVFPHGPKLGDPQEVALRDLTGDGTVTGRILQVVSSLNLNVWSPELTFFFPQDDLRFDLGQAYFTIDQGYRWLKDHLGVGITHPVEVRLHVGNNGVSNAAFYHRNAIYLGRGDGETYKDMIRDPSVLIHESIHAVIDAYVGLPSEGEGGAFNEGFADLFTALILDNPRMAEASYLRGPYRRTVENKLLAYKDFSPGVYQNGSIVAATFWDMKHTLGTELTAKLAFRTLVRLGRGAKFDDLPTALTSAAEGLLNAGQTQQARQALANRGWRTE